MKYILSFLIVLTLGLNQLNSQLTTSLGAKVGLANSKLTSNEFNNIESFTGSSIGGFLNIELFELLALQAEVLGTKRGSNYDFGNIYYETTANYLEFPLLAKLRIPLGDNLRPFLQGGYTMNFITKQSATLDALDGLIVIEDRVNDLYKTGGSAFVGLGLDIETEGILFFLDGRYIVSSGDISNNEVEVRLSGFTASAGIGIKLFK